MAYSQPLHWIIVLKPGWLVMSRFPYNVKSVPIECRRNANNKQNPTTNNPASIFLGFWRWIRQYDITKHASTTSHFRNFLTSQSKRDFLSECWNRRSNAVSIIWARVQQRRFTGEIIVPKQLYFEKALICLCKTCGQSIRTYCVIFLQWNDVAEHTFREIDEWNFFKFSERFDVRRNAFGV